MDLNVEVLNPLVALIAGILILIMPRLLNYVVAIYLIVIGILGLSHLSPLCSDRLPQGQLVVCDANGQSLAYVYSRETKDAADIAKVLTEDEARHIFGTSLRSVESQA